MTRARIPPRPGVGPVARRLGPVGLAVGLWTLTVAPPLAAQVPTASAAWMGTGQNYVADITGFGAIGLNPARLAMPGGPSWSAAIPAATAGFGLDPVGLQDVGEFADAVIPDDVKEDWLRRIARNGGQRGLAQVGATGLSATVGRFGVQISSVGLFRGDLNEDAAELVLFGNAGRTGRPRAFEVGSTLIDGFWVSSVALSGAFPLGVRIGSAEDQHFAVGGNVKLHFGHTALVTRDAAGTLQAEPTSGEVELPQIQTDELSLDNGFGVGLDVAAAWQAGRWSVGATLTNLVNTFSWDFSNLVYRQGEAAFDVGSARSNFDKRSADDAPGALREAIEDSDFDPTLTVGGALRLRQNLKVLADFQQRFGSGIALSPKTRVGAGAEWATFGWLALRAGGSLITDGWRVGGGAGLALGPVNLAGAYLYQGGAVENSDIFSVALSLKSQ